MRIITSIILKLLFILTLIFGVKCANAQSPKLEISFEEVAIDSAAALIIEVSHPGAKCIQVYLNFSEPNWELQTIYADSINPLSLLCEDGFSFYQSPFGDAVSNGINSVFYDVAPDLMYDSFFTIGRLNNTDNKLIVVFNPNLEVPCFTDFEISGGKVLVADDIGAAIAMPMDRSFLPTKGFSDQNIPDKNGRVLIAQLTTNAGFSGVFNFSLRKLNEDHTTFLPTVTTKANQMAFSFKF